MNLKFFWKLALVMALACAVSCGKDIDPTPPDTPDVPVVETGITNVENTYEGRTVGYDSGIYLRYHHDP